MYMDKNESIEDQSFYNEYRIQMISNQSAMKSKEKGKERNPDKGNLILFIRMKIDAYFKN